MSSKARRPYLMGKRSVTQFYQAPVRFLKEIVAKESEFEKPYLEDEYRKMHFDFPWPDWPPFPPIPPWPPWKPPEGPIEGLPGCAIVCYEPLDCDEPVWCHPGIWCGTDIGCTLCTWEVTGATTGYTPHLSGVGSWGIDIWIDSTLVESGKALINVCMTDPCENVCCQDVEVSCCDCAAEPVLSWNVEPPDAMTEDAGTASFSIQGGCPPYTYQVSGVNWSLGKSGARDELTNTIEVVATGGCLGTVTVTDICGDSVEKIIRNNRGSWVTKTTGSCDFVGPADWYAYMAGGDYFEYIKENKRQIEKIVWEGTQVATCGVDDPCDGHCADNYHCLESPFVRDSDSLDITPNCVQLNSQCACFCGHIGLIYQEWECT